MDEPLTPPPPPGKAWRIAVVDDYAIIRAVFKSLVEDDPALEFLWSASTLTEARSHLSHSIPDLLIVDITLPDGEGYELITETLARLPDLRVLVVSSREGEEYARRALDCGARGYLPKSSSPDDIVNAISLIQQGGTCFKCLHPPG